MFGSLTSGQQIGCTYHFTLGRTKSVFYPVTLHTCLMLLDHNRSAMLITTVVQQMVSWLRKWTVNHLTIEIRLAFTSIKGAYELIAVWTRLPFNKAEQIYANLSYIGQYPTVSVSVKAASSHDVNFLTLYLFFVSQRDDVCPTSVQFMFMPSHMFPFSPVSDPKPDSCPPSKPSVKATLSVNV